jgi:endo-1,4-beta-xylanase
MKRKCLFVCIATGMMAIGYISCKKAKEVNTVPPNIPAPDTTALKNAGASFPIGAGINFTLMTGNASYASLVKSQFSAVTFEYQMKNGAIVQDDGSFNFTGTDQLVSLVNGDGLSVYGHCLAWYQNNNGNYLRSLLTAGTPTYAQIQARIDTALKTWVTAEVTRYKTQVGAWDAVNEAINDGTGVLRDNPTPGTTTGDIFYWAEYLGRAYVAKTFQYAHDANPDALLFINDYNLESDAVKLDSLLALVGQLQAQQAPISGIGTQMHISINTSQAGIDQAFIKLAATGLKIRVSELDIRIDPNNTSGFAANTDLYQQQAAMYHYVVSSYLRNVPQAQRYGMTVWDITDNDSWIVTSLHDVDFPTLFDGNYGKKPAYYSYLQGLEGK